jgi:hypothetical protein
MTELYETPTGPAFSYFRLESLDQGPTTMTPAVIDGFEVRSLGGAAAASAIRDVPGTFQNVSFVALPVGWVGEWHESPYPQWVVALQGRWFIEPQDGSRVEMGPGDLHWGADQHTHDDGRGRGHRSGQLGDEPCLLMMVQQRDTLAST